MGCFSPHKSWIPLGYDRFPEHLCNWYHSQLRSGLNRKEISLFSPLGFEWIHEASCNWMSGKCQKEILSKDTTKKVSQSKTVLVLGAQQMIRGHRSSPVPGDTHWSSRGSAKSVFYASSHLECAKWLLSHSTIFPSNTSLWVSLVRRINNFNLGWV